MRIQTPGIIHAHAGWRLRVTRRTHIIKPLLRLWIKLLVELDAVKKNALDQARWFTMQINRPFTLPDQTAKLDPSDGAGGDSRIAMACGKKNRIRLPQ